MTPADQPWKAPAVGDTLTMRDGRKRTVLELPKVHYGYWVRWEGTGPTGRRVRVYASQTGWERTARVEVAKGGSYVRGGG